MNDFPRYLLLGSILLVVALLVWALVAATPCSALGC